MPINPYHAGLLIGIEIDVVLANINGEPVDPKNFLEKEIEVFRKIGNGRNRLKVYRDMVRIYASLSTCRAYAVDNLWFCLKNLIMELKKEAFLSFYGENRLNDRRYVAGGHIRLGYAGSGIYVRRGEEELKKTIISSDSKEREEFIRNLNLTVGLLGCLLDRRYSAKIRREKYGPGTDKFIRQTEKFFTYQGLTNFWLYHPCLCHMIMGAARMASFITINELSDDICKQKEFTDKEIAEAIRLSDFETIEKIWNKIKYRFQKINHPKSSNPFTKPLVRTIDFIRENGIGTLGPSVYDNWRMKRKRDNYAGHLADLPSWEFGVNKIFNKKHPLYKDYKEFIQNGKHREKSKN